MISIILPTYNSIRFLDERIKSIVDQSYKNWECIVIDGYSTDGTWEKLNQVSINDKRFKLFQFEPLGPYNAWNKGIEQSIGKYIYIATSDDTMVFNCLETLYFGLENNVDCGIAHCNLTIIDENSNVNPNLNWNDFYPALFYGDLLYQKHIRIAPLDGILHCTFKTIYTSITQLLIRKTVLNKLGLFLEDNGTIADFEWGMRISLLYNTLHIPQHLATWRKYDGQLTTDEIQQMPKTYETLRYFIKHALNIGLSNGLEKKYISNQLYNNYLIEEFKIISSSNNKLKIIKFLFKYPIIIYWKFFSKKMFTNDIMFTTKNLIRQLGLNQNIKPLNINQ